MTSSAFSGPLSTFQSARISFAFAYKERYDQGGLVLALHRGGGGSTTSSSSAAAGPLSFPAPKWIKTGVEFYNGRPMLSTVACDAWADWSVTPLPPSPPPSNASAAADQKQWTTVAIVREGDEKGKSLWVYQVVPSTDGSEGGEEKIPMREICWVSGDGPEEEWELGVAAMAARPEKTAAEELSVEFKDFEVVWGQ